MTVSASDIPLISPYTVSDSAGSKFTTAEFTRHFAKAQARLDREAPSGMASDEYDQAHALLICHMHAVKLGSAGLKSESIGEYSYSQDPGMTSYLQEYLALMSGNASPSTDDLDNERADATMSEMDLDQSQVPDYSGRTE